jgi:hypothetical protein
MILLYFSILDSLAEDSGAIPIANVKSATPVTSGAEREHARAANRLWAVRRLRPRQLSDPLPPGLEAGSIC